MIKFKTHEEFFSYLEDDHVQIHSCGGFRSHVTVEEMYQHFKACLISELRVDSVEFLNYAELIDCEDNEVKE